MTVQGQLLYMLETVAEAIGDDLRLPKCRR